MDHFLDRDLLAAFVPRFIAGLVALWLSRCFVFGLEGHKRYRSQLKNLTWLLPIFCLGSAWRVLAYYYPGRPLEADVLRDAGIWLGTASIAAWWPACLVSWAVYAMRAKEQKRNESQQVERTG
jgi:hypothetical protein